MPKGIWVWPSDAKSQRRALRKVAGSPHLMAAIAAMAKSKEGTSDSELSEALGDGSEWTTLWVIRQLTSLGFVRYKVDFFGNPARYELTEQGRAALSSMMGQSPPKTPTPTAPAPQSAVPKTA